MGKIFFRIDEAPSPYTSCFTCNPYLRTMRVLLQKLMLLCAVLAGGAVQSQNLLLNGDFERPFLDHEYQWRQPHGAYYHYYMDGRQDGSAYEGNFYNGLCMYNHQENEFMQTKLAQPLVAGQSYCLKVMARLMSIKAFNHELHDKIGILFTSYPFDVEEPFYPGGKPDTYWLIPDTVDRFSWLPLETEYLARGDEQYFTIGYWRSLAFSEQAKDDVFEAFMGPEPANSKTDIPPPDFSAKAKKKRKRGKQHDAWSDFRKQVMEQARSQGEVIPTTSPGEGLFTLRYYLDNLCVAPVLADGSCDCAIPKPPLTLNVGDVVRMDNLLFNTGESTLQPGSDYALELLALILEEQPHMRIAIEGHTDNVGNDAANLKLSEDRAYTVRKHLIEMGVDEERMSARGFGSTRPVADNRTEEGRSLNRRVAFVIEANQ
ncbi:MAG: OmpA family protein [Cryomorphaceae bacterium]|nr:MAG: OmpA family protein [Cryomorphaceae bacterium]